MLPHQEPPGERDALPRGPAGMVTTDLITIQSQKRHKCPLMDRRGNAVGYHLAAPLSTRWYKLPISFSKRESKIIQIHFLNTKNIEESKTNGKYLMIQFIHRVRIGNSKLWGLKNRLVANWRPGH